MQKKIWHCVLILVLSLALAGNSFSVTQKKDAQETKEIYHFKRGISHFEVAIYQLTPKGRSQEAHQEYLLAIQEFKQALVSNPAHKESHRKLARVYVLMKDFEKAATQYQKLTGLDPYDIDTYVLTSLAFIECKNYEQARECLETAKVMTTDPKIVRQLELYLLKLERYVSAEKSRAQRSQ